MDRETVFKLFQILLFSPKLFIQECNGLLLSEKTTVVLPRTLFCIENTSTQISN